MQVFLDRLATLLQVQLQNFKFFFCHDTITVVVVCTIAGQRYKQTTTVTTCILSYAYGIVLPLITQDIKSTKWQQIGCASFGIMRQRDTGMSFNSFVNMEEVVTSCLKVMSGERLSYDGLRPNGNVIRISLEEPAFGHAEEQAGLSVFY